MQRLTATIDGRNVVVDAGHPRVAGKRIVVGHVSPRGGWVVDASVAKVFVAGRDYRLNLVLKRTVVTITLDGQVITSYAYNSRLADGQTGVFGRGVG